MLSEVQITVGEEMTVWGMVVLGVEIYKIAILETRNGFRVASRVESILALFEQVFVYVLKESLLWTTHGTLHLVVDHAFDFNFTFGVIPLLEFEPMTLLTKIILVKRREERHIAIHCHQISEILSILRTKGIHREITTCPRIHISVETSPDHLHERIANWISFWTTSCQMLENVRLASVVIWRSSEKDGESVIEVWTVEMEVPRFGKFMCSLEGCNIEVI